ncbi:hypothetical protein [Pseudooceanicola sp.]|uniref:hypothetical protein n=1 Tax=Pseudooceanicola sp. TaxID=1914328 RepID=UPI003514BAFC
MLWQHTRSPEKLSAIKGLSLWAFLSILAGCYPTTAERSYFALTAAETSAVKRAASYNLKDPSSAQFRNIRGIEGTDTSGAVHRYVCGQVNGKNSFGAYSGFNTFVAEIAGTGVDIVFHSTSQAQNRAQFANCGF